LVHMDVSAVRTVENVDVLITQPPKQQTETAMEKAITLLLHYPELANTLDDLESLNKLVELKLPYTDLFIWLIYLLRDFANITGSEILERCKTSEDVNFLARLLVDVPLIAEDSLKSEFLGIIDRCYMRIHESTIENLMQRARRGELQTEEKLVLQNLIKKTKY